MSLPSEAVAAIQRAGQAVHDASQLVSGTVNEQAHHMVNSVATQPLAAHSEQTFTQFKLLATLSHNLRALEETMRGIYAAAIELANPEMDVIATSKPSSNPAARTTHLLPSTTVDAVVKPAAPATSARAARQSRAAKSKRGPKPSPLTPNDLKLLHFLQKTLSTTQWARVTGKVMAQGSGLPMGSVGVSLTKLISKGKVLKDDLGYQLAP